jgi:hypothetical protein
MAWSIIVATAAVALLVLGAWGAVTALAGLGAQQRDYDDELFPDAEGDDQSWLVSAPESVEA